MNYHDRSLLPIIAGMFMIIVSMIAIVNAVDIIRTDINLEEHIAEDAEEEHLDMAKGIVAGFQHVCGAIFFIMGIFLFIGGILSIKYIHWPIALVASIFGIFAISPFCLGSILSVLAVIMIYVSEKEFNGKMVDIKYCMLCGNQMVFVEGYQRWYCENCQRYVEQDI